MLPIPVAALLIAAARLPLVLPALRARYGSCVGRRRWTALAAHLALFAIVIWLSGAVIEGPDQSVLLLVAWTVTGAAMVGSWVFAMIPGVARGGPTSILAATLAAGGGLGLLAGGVGAVTREWWQPLGRSTVWVVYVLLRGLGFDAGADPERFLVGTPTFVVEIAPYCSGYQGVGLMWVFLGAYLWLFRARLRFPRAFWLVPLGTALVWVLNAVRLAVLVVIGSHGYEDVAMQGFHYHAGTLFFCATALGLGAWAASSPLFSVTPSQAPAGVESNPTAAYVLPFVALLATSLVTGTVSSGGLDVLYGVRVVVAAVVVWQFRARLVGAGWRASWEGAALGAGAFAVWLALAGAGGAGDGLGAGLAALDPVSRASWVALRLVGAIAVVPLVEELAFRGYLARRLVAPDFDAVSLRQVTWPALLASALLFGLMHEDALAGAAVGLLYGLAARRRGQLGDAVLAHAVTNALLAAAVLATGRWALWE